MPLRVAEYNLRTLRFREITKIAEQYLSIPLTYEWNRVIAFKPGFPSRKPKLLVVEENDREMAYWAVIQRGIKPLTFISVFAEPVILEESRQQEIWEALLKHIKSMGPVRFSMNQHVFLRLKDVSAVAALGLKNISWEEFGSFSIDLTKPLEELWAAVHSKHRNAIRKGEREGLKVAKMKERQQIRDYFALAMETSQRSALKSPSIKHYENIYDELVGKGLCDWYFITDQQERPLSGAVVTKIGGLGIYLYGASLRNIPQGVGNLLHWKIIQDLKEQKLTTYDLGGVKLNPSEGSKSYLLYRFKKRFGGPPQVYYSLTWIVNPQWHRLIKFPIPFTLNKDKGQEGLASHG